MNFKRRPALNVALRSCLAFALLSFIAPGSAPAQDQQQQPKTEAPKTTARAHQQTPVPAATPKQEGREAGPVE
ncbi:MAG TPA: hypothetical protein VEV81_05775, partial [Pyrinomonadaceae bacterium]|nr:hypothetical protein [Pyrinomonadaceae bacterium]